MKQPQKPTREQKELIDPDGYGIHIETKIENVREKE